MIAPGHRRLGKAAHFVKAGGGKSRSSICGKEVGPARSWLMGTGGLGLCKDCKEIACRKYGITP